MIESVKFIIYSHSHNVDHKLWRNKVAIMLKGKLATILDSLGITNDYTSFHIK